MHFGASTTAGATAAIAFASVLACHRQPPRAPQTAQPLDRQPRARPDRVAPAAGHLASHLEAPPRRPVERAAARPAGWAGAGRYRLHRGADRNAHGLGRAHVRPALAGRSGDALARRSDRGGTGRAAAGADHGRPGSDGSDHGGAQPGTRVRPAAGRRGKSSGRPRLRGVLPGCWPHAGQPGRLDPRGEAAVRRVPDQGRTRAAHRQRDRR